MKTNKNKATHLGECQICGSRQMLPCGRMAKHGYTTKWGFFSGTCAGSECLPFEQSTDQIDGAVNRMEAQVALTDSEAASCEDINSERNSTDSAVKRVYPRHGDGYIWAKCRVVNFTSTDYGDGAVAYRADFVTDESFFGKKGIGSEKRPIEDKIEAYDKMWKMPTVRHWVCFLHTEFAKSLRRTNDQRRTWLKWQAYRLHNWAEQPLQPRAVAAGGCAK